MKKMKQLKKLISLTLALSVVLSVCGMLAAEAKPYDGYPFVYEDFETDNIAEQKAAGLISSNNGVSFHWTADGAAGSKGALDVTENGGYQHMRFPISSESMVIGQTIRYSCWIKPMNTEYASKQVQFILYGYGKAGTTGWSRSSATVKADLKQGEWTYVEVDWVWDGVLDNNGQAAMDQNGGRYFDFDPSQPMRMEIRIGSGTIANEFPGVSAEDRPSFVNYLLDDVIMEPVNAPDTNAQPVEANNLFVGSDMNSAEALGNWRLESVNAIKELSQDLSPDGTNYMILRTPDDGSKVWTEIKQQVNVRANHLYKVTFSAKVNSHNQAGFSIIGWWGVANSTVFPQYPMYHSSVTALSKSWKDFEFYIYADSKAVQEKTCNWGIRFFYDNSVQHVTSANASYSIDNLKLLDMGSISNSTMEMEAFPQAGILLKNASSNSAYFNASDVPFWFESGATAAKSAEVRSADTYEEGETVSTGSMLVTADNDGGYVYQPIFLENNREYLISFWAKGNNLAEDKPITIRMDRTVAEKESLDVFDVQDEEILDEGYMLTNEWQKYEFVYTTAFTAATIPSGAIPRLPYMNIAVGDNAAGTSYYLDDVTLEVYDPNADPNANKYKFPYADRIEFSGGAVSGEDVTVSYGFRSDIDSMEGRSMLRLKKKAGENSWITLATAEAEAFRGQGSITIPESAAGEDIKVELALVDERGYFGTVYAYEINDVQKAFVLEPSITEWNAATGEITAQAYVSCNTARLGERDILFILAQYDADGAMVRMTSEAIHVALGVNTTLDLSADAEATAKSAKLFVWSGTSLADAGEAIYANAIALEK